MSTPIADVPALDVQDLDVQDLDPKVTVATCLSEHTLAGVSLMVALCAGMAAFVTAAVGSYALGALVGVLMIGLAGMAVALVPIDRR